MSGIISAFGQQSRPFSESQLYLMSIKSIAIDDEQTLTSATGGIGNPLVVSVCADRDQGREPASLTVSGLLTHYRPTEVLKTRYIDNCKIISIIDRNGYIDFISINR